MHADDTTTKFKITGRIYFFKGVFQSKIWFSDGIESGNLPLNTRFGADIFQESKSDIPVSEVDFSVIAIVIFQVFWYIYYELWMFLELFFFWEMMGKSDSN